MKTLFCVVSFLLFAIAAQANRCNSSTSAFEMPIASIKKVIDLRKSSGMDLETLRRINADDAGWKGEWSVKIKAFNGKRPVYGVPRGEIVKMKQALRRGLSVSVCVKRRVFGIMGYKYQSQFFAD